MERRKTKNETTEKNVNFTRSEKWQRAYYALLNRLSHFTVNHIVELLMHLFTFSRLVLFFWSFATNNYLKKKKSFYENSEYKNQVVS